MRFFTCSPQELLLEVEGRFADKPVLFGRELIDNAESCKRSKRTDQWFGQKTKMIQKESHKDVTPERFFHWRSFCAELSLTTLFP